MNSWIAASAVKLTNGALWLAVCVGSAPVKRCESGCDERLAGRLTAFQECPNDFYVSVLNGLNERRISTLIYVEAQVRRLESHRDDDRKNPNVPVSSMSVDGAVCNMARTALRSPSATALKRGEAIIFVGDGVGEKRGKDRDAKGGSEAET
jgi:hypothetical protein